MSENNECIQVIVRCRPANSKEKEEKRVNIVDVDVEAKQVAIKNPANSKEAPKYFTFDATYDENTQQKLFYEESCFSVIESTLEGFNSTIFAYGQTGCGKSFTMQGPSTTNEEMRGVIPNSFAHIFQSVKASKDVEFLIRCSYLELYNEEIKDLLCNPKSAVKCDLKEDVKKGVFIKGLTDVVVENEDDLNRMLEKGLTQRTTASTNMNAESSRSHSIFTIIVEMSTKEADGKEMLRVGKLNLVDLAGSERQTKTGATGAVLKEGIRINLSLTALGNVIQALSEGSSRHIPYRDSKLTRLLQDSLGGNTKTMMIAAISPADYNYDETMSTLRYANRAKNIKNKPKINEDPKDAVIREYKDEIEKLRRELLERDAHIARVASLQSQVPASAPVYDQQGLYNDLEDNSSATIQYGSQIATSFSARGTTQEEKLGVSFPLDGFHQSSNENSVKGGSPPPDYYADDDVTAQQPPASKKIAQQTDVAHQNHHEILRQKESEIEAERQMREELALRLEQLEHLLVNNHHEGGSSPRAVSIKKANSPVKLPPSKEEKEQEEEAMRKYKERKLKAKKKREQQQQEEMQRILEEKRSMEEELEELRQSVVSAAVGGNNNGPRAFTPNNVNEATSDSSTVKKMARMKKRYEKKLGAVMDDLNDMREDFYYQRKQLMDAVVEQEKDTKLYESICRSLLNEKDLKKIVDKCHYDEICDEWIVPFLKKKNVDNLDQAPMMSASVINSSNGSNGLPKIGNNSSMLPDIANKGGGGGHSHQDKVDMNSVQVLNNNKINGSGGYNKGTSNYSQNDNYNTGDKSSLIVPLLSLPGGMVTSASLMSPNGNNNNGGKQQVLSSRLPADIHGGTYEYANGSESGRGNGDYIAGGDMKKNKPKNKIPKMPTNKLTDQNSSGHSQSQSASHQQQTTKMPSLNGNNYSQNSGRLGRQDSAEKVVAPAKINAAECQIDEQGTGETAGPLDEWGFLQDDFAIGGERNSSEQPELEYSDDEDFVSSDNNKHSKHKKGGGHGKKKKKKHNNSSENDNCGGGYNSGDKSTPRQQQFSLPPI